ncbi:twin-arginine translocation pathway signal [Mycobacterium noviomagense]|nr:twin-arginine translocation pathway signal [Mycobacterium noviomagense]ORB14834.1 twin-arginine translocation pathway signal [Mycobacterium noviomagense]
MRQSWGLIRRCMAMWRPIVLITLLLASTGWAVGLFFVQYRPDQQTDKAAADEAVKAASDGAVALLSYSPDSLSRDFANAKSRLSDDFQDYYKRFTEQIVAPAAQRGLTTTVRVVKAAASELHPKSAVVLVFIDQKTASKEKPEPVKSGSSVRVTLTKVKGSWLIAKFDAVS